MGCPAGLLREGEKMDPKNIFVVGMDEFNQRKLKIIEQRKLYRFHTLFRFDEVAFCERFDIPSLIKEGESRLDAFTGTVDGVMGFWDFPTMCLVALLCERNRLPGPSLKSVLMCEHKYWSRFEQSQIIPEAVPSFFPVNPFDPKAADQVDLDFPFWLKPVKSYSSYLGKKIHTKEELKEHLLRVRDRIGRFAEPFNFFLEQVELPDKMKGIDGYYCVAEQLIEGEQCTVEGYVHNHKVVAHGIIDSIRHQGSSSFASYRYPSSLPQAVKDRMFRLSEEVMAHFGYNNAAFNIEYFWDREADQIWLLEVNSRISQSHSDIFEKVDGQSNQEIVADLCLGRDPNWQYQKGPYKYASKFFYREFEDAWVERVPSADELNEISQLISGVEAVPQVEEGMRLSDLPDQDSYSYEVALIYVGGENQDDLLRKYNACMNQLNFKLTPVGAQKPRDQADAIARGDSPPV